MAVSALVLCRDPDLRRRVVDRMRDAGREALDFGDGRSAFLWACGPGRLHPFEDLIVDESIDPEEVDALTRRLALLHPGLRMMRLPTRYTVPSSPEPGPAVPPGPGSREMCFVRSHRERPHRDRRDEDERPARNEESGYATA